MAWLCVRACTGISRTIVTVLFVTLTISGPFVYYSLLSHPKNLADEVRNDKEVVVVAFFPDPGRALYLLLQLPGINQPRYYVMDWNEQTERMVQRLLDGRGKGEEMRMTNPFDSSIETERSVAPAPPEKLPEKIPPPLPEEFTLETDPSLSN